MRRCLVAALLLTPALSLAEPLPPAVSADSAVSDCASARAALRKCELTIEAEEVTGGVVRPDGQAGAFRIFEDLASLFQPRRDFLREIVAATDDVP